MAISLFASLATFSRRLYLWRSYFFTVLQSNYFDTTVTFSEEPFVQSSYFFEELRFRKSHFLAAVILSEYLIFSERNFYRAAISWESEVPYFSEQLLFLAQELFRIKISTDEIFFRTGTSSHHQLFQRSCIFE